MRKFFAIAGAILIVVCGVRVVLGFVRSVDEVVRFDAVVGDCLAGETEADTRVVPCDDPAALRKVVGREIRPVPATEELVNQACAPYAEAEDVFWRTLESDQVLILCLRKISR